MKPIFVLVAVCVLSVAVIAQRNFSSTSPVSENFDTLGTGNVTLDNNTTITGVYFRSGAHTGATHFLRPSDGSSGGPSDVYLNHGSAGAADRALGGRPGAVSSTITYGIRLVNSGTAVISSISVGYTGEHWRDLNGTGPITFDYRVSATPITDLITGTYTSVAALTYTPVNLPGNVGALDGNAAANRNVLAPVNILLSTPLAPGEELMLRWTDTDNGLTDPELAIDDVSVTVIGVSAGEAAISGRITDAFGRAISSATITVQDMSGGTRKVLTNTFGYYNAKGLTVGETYVVSVSSRRHRFASSSFVVDLGDNVGDLNFVASR